MRVAALDLGTNTFILLVCEVELDGSRAQVTKVLRDEVRLVRLGQEVNRTRRLHPEALERARACLVEFQKIISETGPERVQAVATSAARDVENREELLAIGRAAGIPIAIVPGETEAEFTFSGTVESQASDDADELNMIVDIGGGSTEYIVGDKRGIISRISLDIGSVRLTEKFITSHPPSFDERERLNKWIDQELARVQKMLEQNSESQMSAIAVAGTATTLATLDQGRAFESEVVNGYKLTMESLAKWTARLGEMTVEERQKLAGMEPKRADVIFAGATILFRSALQLKIPDFSVSTRGLRFGVAKALARGDDFT